MAWTSLNGIDLNAGRWCLHLAPPCDYDAVANALCGVCQSNGKSLVIANIPRPRPFHFRLMCQPTVYDWLAAAMKTSADHVKQIVDDFPIHVSPDFRRNAMNPMRFLGLAVAIHQTSDVLLYETSGMDPMGIRKIHSYAQEHYNGGCLVHACWQPMGDSCPNAGVCVNVT